MLVMWANAYLRFLATCDPPGCVWWIGPPSGCLICIEDTPAAEAVEVFGG